MDEDAAACTTFAGKGDPFQGGTFSQPVIHLQVYTTGWPFGIRGMVPNLLPLKSFFRRARMKSGTMEREGIGFQAV